ncbi:MAG: hypothetical protein E7460_07635 [Ruminococcaceae bacterium]|nr:hypothetical protein [Oscillospiraceae bacterium]
MPYTVTKKSYTFCLENGFCRVLNPSGAQLTAFPLSARFCFSGRVSETPGEVRSSAEGLCLDFAGLPPELSFARLEVSFREDGILFGFSAGAKSAISVESLEYLRRGNRALFANDNTFNFSPAPRNASGHGTTLYKRPCDCSGDGYFAPPPHVMVMGNRAGKVAFSLLELPRSKQFKFSDKYGVLAEVPGGNLTIAPGEVYTAPGLLLSFPSDEWEALETCKNSLSLSPTAIEDKNLPSWWKRFAVDSYGDQITQLQYNAFTADDWASPGYNTAWLYSWLEKAEARLARRDFTVVIDAFWQYEWALDPLPDQNRFAGLRGFIDHCHRRGHKVLLWIVPLASDRRDHLPADRQTLIEKFGVKKPEGTLDLTADTIEDYFAEYCRLLFSGEEGCLDGDGVKVDGPFLFSDPVCSTYAHPERGVGCHELLNFYRIFTAAAKKIKPDVLINTSTANPFFQDDVHICRLGDQSVREERETRARICSAVAPNVLLDSDGVMDSGLIKEDYLAATVYSVPYLYNTDSFMIGERPSDETMAALGRLLSLSEKKPWGRPVFVSNGNWLWKTRETVTAACFDYDTVIVFSEDRLAYVFSWSGGIKTLPTFGHLPEESITLDLAPGEIFTFSI